MVRRRGVTSGAGGRSLRPRAGCPRLKRKAAARLPGPAGARHLPLEQDKKAAVLVPDGLDLHTSQSEKDAFHAAALRSKLQLRKAPTKNLSLTEIISSGLISSVCAAANLRGSEYSGSTVPIHDVKPNLNRPQSESPPVKDSGALTNLGFNGLRFGFRRRC